MDGFDGARPHPTQLTDLLDKPFWEGPYSQGYSVSITVKESSGLQSTNNDRDESANSLWQNQVVGHWMGRANWESELWTDVVVRNLPNSCSLLQRNHNDWSTCRCFKHNLLALNQRFHSYLQSHSILVFQWILKSKSWKIDDFYLII